MSTWILIALLARQVGPDAAGAASPVAPPGKVIVVALAGRLSPEEIAGPGSPAGGLGKPGPDGVLLERVAFTLPDAPARLEGLRDCLFPPGVTPATVRLEEGALPGPPPLALQRLQARFGAPPARRSEETEAVARLRKAAGAPGTPRPRASEDVTLGTVRTARVSLVLIEAASASAEDVRRRSETVRRILESAGDGAHVLIACVPEKGTGSVLAMGPLFRPGHVINEDKPATIVRAAISFILERGAQAKDVGEAAGLFR
jgi:hypothetical protein